MLVEMTEYFRAREVLAPVLATEWAPYARTLLAQIAFALAPRLEGAFTARDDDQPLRGALRELGWIQHPGPTSTVSARVRSHAARSGTSADASVVEGTIELGWRAPFAGTRVALGARALRRDDVTRLSPTLFAAQRVGPGLVISARLERTPYLSTIASLAEPLDPLGGTIAVDVDRRGWLGQLGASTQQWRDDNRVTAAWSWLLAPVVRSVAADFHLGAAASAQDAQETRARLVSPQGTQFRYDPYYTPNGLRTVAALAALRLRLGASATARINASAGTATESAPYRAATGNRPQFASRTFAPYTLRAAFDRAIGAAAFQLSAERIHAAFYTATTGRAQFSWTWLPRGE